MHSPFTTHQGERWEQYHLLNLETRGQTNVAPRTNDRDVRRGLNRPAWIFGLRCGEAREVGPGHIACEAKTTLRDCLEVKPKGSNNPQHVVFHQKYMEPDEIEDLRLFQSWGPAGKEGKRDFPEARKANRILQAAITPKSGKQLVFHSIRHGRITCLQKVRGGSDSDLHPFGR